MLAAALSAPGAAPAAWADSVTDAQETLDAAEARLTQISDEHAKLQQEADDLQVQIDDAVEGVMAAQSEMQEGRARLGEMVSYEYKTGGVGVLKVILESENLSELLDNLHYVDSMQKAQAEEIDLQRQREEAFTAALDDLNDKKDAQMAKVDQAEKKSAEAAQVVSNAEAQLSKAQDEAAAAEAERLAALKAQAEALAAEQEAAAQAEAAQEEAAQEQADDANAAGSGDAEADASGGSSNGGGASNGGSNNSSNNGSNGGSDSSQEGWKTGSASAYGSESDGTLGASTATGAVVTETSMGVAIPLSWPNARSYLGRQVEISYGGSTVIATVNDLGGMGGGSRSLDLQPGVWKAFGASSCFDWGVRTVSYRFL